MKESKYQQLILKYIKDKGGWCFTSHGGSQYQVAGLPDVIACYKGVFLGLELKTGKYKATELQKSKLNNIQRAGGVGQILRDDFDEIDKIFNYIDKHGQAPKQTLYKVNMGVIIDD